MALTQISNDYQSKILLNKCFSRVSQKNSYQLAQNFPRG